ncbi:MAG: hypothetical protein E6Q97_15240 [Desulfurellales bacterium]|nr:MAG: hypothetical protein E6Q97_15240 [Desulfurellales bacterium]
MDANSLYGAALETVKRFWQMNEARHAACRAYQFDGSDESKQTMIRWQVYQNFEDALLLQANALKNMAIKAGLP